MYQTLTASNNSYSVILVPMNKMCINDFQALAVGYSSGSVYIVDIEDKEVLDRYVLEQETDDCAVKRLGVRCITWAVRNSTLESATEYNLYVSNFIHIYLIY